jgi:predicted N-acetyltransferase YhbS
MIVGYYCLSASTVSHVVATGSVRRNMPDPVPMLLLGRLAVDRRWQGKGLGRGLLKDAVLRSVQVSDHIGIRGLLVHAISEDARRF